MATCTQLQTWLAAAETALHNVTVGGVVKVLRHGEKHIEYSQGNRADLVAYVRELRNSVAACTGDTTRVRGRVIGVIPQG